MLESMEKAGNANPDKDKKMEMLKEATNRELLIMNRLTIVRLGKLTSNCGSVGVLEAQSFY